jgi:hypothetical protein
MVVEAGITDGGFMTSSRWQQRPTAPGWSNEPPRRVDGVAGPLAALGTPRRWDNSSSAGSGEAITAHSMQWGEHMASSRGTEQQRTVYQETVTAIFRPNPGASPDLMMQMNSIWQESRALAPYPEHRRRPRAGNQEGGTQLNQGGGRGGDERNLGVAGGSGQRNNGSSGRGSRGGAAGPAPKRDRDRGPNNRGW